MHNGPLDSWAHSAILNPVLGGPHPSAALAALWRRARYPHSLRAKDFRICALPCTCGTSGTRKGRHRITRLRAGNRCPDPGAV